MMSRETIRDLQLEAAEKAAKKQRKPLVIWPQDMDHIDKVIVKIPNLGDYIHPDFELVETLFVDKTGLGRPGEPALTFEEFCKKVQPGFGYGLYEEGQFQVHVGVYKRKKVEPSDEG